MQRNPRLSDRRFGVRERPHTGPKRGFVAFARPLEHLFARSKTRVASEKRAGGAFKPSYSKRWTVGYAARASSRPALSSASARSPAFLRFAESRVSASTTEKTVNPPRCLAISTACLARFLPKPRWLRSSSASSARCTVCLSVGTGTPVAPTSLFPCGTPSRVCWMRRAVRSALRFGCCSCSLWRWPFAGEGASPRPV